MNKKVEEKEDISAKIERIAYSLLITAKEDLKTSRLLYECGRYPAALFYFQQSIEKFNKYWLCMIERNNFSNLNDLNNTLKELGHQFAKHIVAKICTLDKICKPHKKRYYEHEDIQKKIDFIDLPSFISRFKEIIKENQIKNKDICDLKEVFQEINKIQIQTDNIMVQTLGSSLRSYEVLKKNMDFHFVSKNIKNIIKATTLQLWLDYKFNLAIACRYPLPESQYDSPYNYYTKGNQLVKDLPQLYSLYDEFIKELSKN